MVKLELKPLKRNKRKYSSYKGTVGKIADNLIERDFDADKPNEKWYTDVTEFNLRGEKIYLSPIIDGFNQEVKSYDISKSPNLEQINHISNWISYSFWFMTPSSSDNNTAIAYGIYSSASFIKQEVNKNDYYYTKDGIQPNVFPTLYLKSTTNIVSGDGSEENPYILS